MPSIAPLQILLFRHPADARTASYEAAIVRAFQGGKEAGGYLATGEDLGMQYGEFSGAPPVAAREKLDSFCHSLTIILIDTSLLGAGNALWDWLADCWEHTRTSDGRHTILAVALDEGVGASFSTIRPVFNTLQLLQVYSLGEPAIRPAMLALRLLHECRLLLANALPASHGYQGHLKLFISHAKIDGLPLALALKHQIDDLAWLGRFYDVEDLPAGRDWQVELERGVGASLIVILRTEVYDSRHWCRQEVLWADEYATPALLVDARTGLNHPAAALPLERIPTVRIPDGNLMRILFLALREGVRFLYFMRQVEQMKLDGEISAATEVRVFSYPPSMAALLRACHALTAAAKPVGTQHLILYPDPPLRAGLYEAAETLVEKFAPADTRLMTPNALAVARGGIS
jgi:hypothetical protein